MNASARRTIAYARVEGSTGGSYAPGLTGVAVIFAAGVVVLLELGTRWSRRWDAAVVRQAGIYSYRGTAGAGEPAA
jgi:hypothetical protein